MWYYQILASQKHFNLRFKLSTYINQNIIRTSGIKISLNTKMKVLNLNQAFKFLYEDVRTYVMGAYFKNSFGWCPIWKCKEFSN